MTFVLASQFHIYLPWDNARLALCLNTFLNKKALLGTFNLEKALVLVGAFSVIVQLHRWIDLRRSPQHQQQRAVPPVAAAARALGSCGGHHRLLVSARPAHTGFGSTD